MLFVLTVFMLMPTLLLLLYPFSWFQKFLTSFHVITGIFCTLSWTPSKDATKMEHSRILGSRSQPKASEDRGD